LQYSNVLDTVIKIKISERKFKSSFLNNHFFQAVEKND